MHLDSTSIHINVPLHRYCLGTQWYALPLVFGPRSSMYTGLIARTRLILQNTFPRELQLPQVQDLLALHTLQEPRYRECIPQIISIARSFGHKWTRQQLTPFDWKEAVVAAFWFCAFHSNCNLATVATVQTFFCNIPPKTPGSQCDICFSVIDYIQFSSLVYVRCSTLYGSRYCNTLAYVLYNCDLINPFTVFHHCVLSQPPDLRVLRVGISVFGEFCPSSIDN